MNGVEIPYNDLKEVEEQSEDDSSENSKSD